MKKLSVSVFILAMCFISITSCTQTNKTAGTQTSEIESQIKENSNLDLALSETELNKSEISSNQSSSKLTSSAINSASSISYNKNQSVSSTSSSASSSSAASSKIVKQYNIPDEVVIYKGGSTFQVTDSDKIFEIIAVLQNWSNEGDIIASLQVKEELIVELKTKETSVELFYKTKPVLISDKKDKDSYSKLIPLTGDYKNMIFSSFDGKFTDGPHASGINYNSDTRLSDVINSIKIK